jgi:hypothetical protein
MSLDACSILTVYKGVLDIDELAVTAVTAHNTTAAPAAAIAIFCFPSIVITSF